MESKSTAQAVMFPDLFGRPLTAVFDVPNASADGGGILLKRADDELGLTDHLSRCLVDRRQPGKVQHGVRELLAQRVFGIACGYPDGNDASRLRRDPIHRMLVGLEPRSEDLLASQPTLCRFENAVTARDAYRAGETFFELVVDRHRRRVGRSCRKVTIDLDVTDDPTHGAQQLTFFNAFYGGYCYLTLVAFLRFDDEPEQYLCAAVLRAGNAPTQRGVLALLRRMLPRLRHDFPRARMLVRLDGGFASPELFEALDSEQRVDYVVGMARNARVLRLCRRSLGRMRKQSRRSGRTEHTYGDGLYRAGSWSHRRRIIYKAEVVRLEDRPPRDNPRFLVTNLTISPRYIYEHVYCQRGEIENRIKELHYGLEIDRTSCSRFLPNQLRVLLTAAAYALLQEIRLAAVGTSLHRAQAWTLRERLFKVGALVQSSVRRIVLRFPEAFAFRTEWCEVASVLGARPG